MQRHRGPIKSHFVNKRSHLRVIIYERAVATVISLTVGYGSLASAGRGGFFSIASAALHLELAFAESCPPHLRPRACALVRNNMG